MIDFKAISIQNFNSIGFIEYFEFSPGIHSVQGINLDEERSKSNGSGKSSFFDAIVWCLYGKTPNGKSADSIINRVKGADCFVKLWFTIDDHEYRIERYRGHSTEGRNIKVFVDEQDRTTHPPSKNQETIDSIIKIPFELFTSSFVIAQGLENRFTALTDFQRKETIEGVRDTKVWDISRELARSKKKELSTEIDEIQVTITSKEELANSLFEDLRSVKLELKELMSQANDPERAQREKELQEQEQRFTTEKEALEEKKKALSQKREDSDEALAKTNRELNNIPDQINVLQKEIDQYQEITKLSDYKAEQEGLEARVKQLSEELGVETLQQELEAAQKQLEKAKKDYKEANKQHTEAYDRWINLKSEAKDIENKINTSEEKLEFYEHTLDPDHEAEECPTCGEIPQGEAIKEKYDEEKENRAELLVQLEEKETARNQAEEEVGEAEDKVSSKEEEVTELEDTVADKQQELNTAEVKLSQLSGEGVAIERKISKVEDLIQEKDLSPEDVASIRKKIEENTKKIEKLQENRSELQESIENLTHTRQEISKNLGEVSLKIANLNEKLQETASELAEIAKEQQRIDTLLQTKQESIEKVIEKREEAISAKEQAVQKRQKLEAVLPVYENLDKIFSPKGIRAHIISKDIGFLNKRLDYYSKHFFSDMYIQLDPGIDEEGNVSKIDIPVRTTMNFEKRYEDCSGGERRRIDICVQLAIFDLILSISSVTTNLLVLDEVFEGLDSEGVKAVMDVVQNLGEEGASIYVISHLPNLGEHVQDHVTFVKQDGVTQLDNEFEFAA